MSSLANTREDENAQRFRPPMILAYVASVALFLLPFYYGWKIAKALPRKSLASPWPPAICLLLWLAQWPPAIFFGAGCMGGGCAGTWLSNTVTFVVLVAYNFGPAYWLWRRS